MADIEQLGKEIKALSEAVQQMGKQLQELQHSAAQSSPNVLHLVGVIPVEAFAKIEGLTDEVKANLKTARSGYKYVGQTYGPRPAFGLWVPSGHVDRTPQCGYMNLMGSQMFVQLLDVYWLCAEGFVQYWFNGFNRCA